MMSIGIDPRIRARRVAVRRAEGRKRLRFLSIALGLVASALAVWGLSRSPLLDLDHVRIDDLAGSRLAEVEAAVDLETGMPLFELDLGEAATAVEALPWIATAVVTREWPGTVRVTVEERLAVAVLGLTEQVNRLIDAEGVVTGPAPSDSPLPVIALPSTVALGETEPAAEPAIALARAIPDDLRPWIEAITIGSGSGATSGPFVGLDLVGSARVEMGTAELLDDKLAALRAILAGVDLSCLDVIDIAVADVVTVTRDPVCEGQVS